MGYFDSGLHSYHYKWPNNCCLAFEAALINYLGRLGRWPVDREDDYRVVFISTMLTKVGVGSVEKSKGSQSHSDLVDLWEAEERRAEDE